MSAFDRESALKTAEKALRQGRIDAAIAEYVRIVQAQPRDWNSANTLGDLYVRGRQVDQGIAQYMRIADQLYQEGFHPKAGALYRKILKIRPADESALWQSGEVAARQGLLADAKTAFVAVSDLRLARGDSRGVAEVRVRLGTLDPADLRARLDAAQASADLGDARAALDQLQAIASQYGARGDHAEALAVLERAYALEPGDAHVRSDLLESCLRGGAFERARAVAVDVAELELLASALEAAGRGEELLDVLADIVGRDPHNLPVRLRLATAHLAGGDYAAARGFLAGEAAGTAAPAWLLLAEIELRAGRLDDGHAAVVRMLALDAALGPAAVALGCRLAADAPDSGYVAVGAAVDHLASDNDYAGAAAALRQFTAHATHHMVALMRLVDVCVDGRLDEVMADAQADLADAYLATDRGLEARIIAEDLLARSPWDDGHVARFRRALVMLGEDDPDAIVAECQRGESPFLASDLDLNDGEFFEADSGNAAPPTPPVPPARSSPEAGTRSKRASGVRADAAAGIEAPRAAPATAAAPVTPAASVTAVPDAVAPVSPPPEPRSLDQVFSQMRDEVNRGEDAELAAEQLGLARTYADLGMNDEAIEAGRAAARSPVERFEAASFLARLYREQGDDQLAIEWFERAAEAPPTTVASGRALLYDLAESLEKVGEHVRALAVFVELEAESGGYRDAASRIESLSQARTEG